ncbi:MAG: electron transfer flavoprotein subunit beta/FixA family protein [Fibrobacteria bacterium]|nr:electron transfer flavoprotein subunit beta/FixA family protein [Fibrobacteria bacterium]
MKIAVIVKRVPDTASVIKIGPDNKSVETDGLKFVLSPYDEHAVEQAVQLAEKGECEVVVVSAGGEECKETMRMALAMGADSGVLVKDDAITKATGKGVAICLAGALKDMGVDLIFAGKQAVDDDGSQVAERVAELLNISHASVINGFILGEGKVEVVREIEGGSYNMEIPLPALFTAQKGLNTPRYPKLPNIMKAKKKEIKELSLADIGVSEADITSGLEVTSMEYPRERSGGRVLEGDTPARVAELVNILKEDEKVIYTQRA